MTQHILAQGRPSKIRIGCGDELPRFCLNRPKKLVYQPVINEGTIGPKLVWFTTIDPIAHNVV